MKKVFLGFLLGVCLMTSTCYVVFAKELGQEENVSTVLEPSEDIADEAVVQTLADNFRYEETFDENDEAAISIVKYIGNEKDVVIPEEIEGKRVIDLGSYAFENCKTVESIILPDTMISVYSNAFVYAENLKSIFISQSVEELGDNLFGECSSLENIVVDSNNEYYSSEDGVLFKKDKTELIQYPEGKKEESYIVPDGVIKLDAFSFMGSSLCNLTLSSTVEEVHMQSFEFCENLNDIYVEQANGTFSSHDGVLFNKDGTKLVMYPHGRKDASYVVPEVVDVIGKGAFLELKNLSSIDLTDVSMVEGNAFQDSSIKSVKFSNTLQDIGEYAFDNCKLLETVILPDSLQSIGAYAFGGCSGLVSINIPKNITSLDGTFSRCSNLKNIVVPDSVTYIGSYTFYSCSNITVVNAQCVIEEMAFNRGKIYGYEGSTAEIYAKKNGLEFRIICPQHSYGEYDVTKQPTVWEPGIKTRTCTICGETEQEEIARLKPTIKLNATSIVLKRKQSTTKVKVSGLAAGDNVKSWKSSNTKIVKVSSKGKITAQKKTGSAKITVTLASGKTAKISVKVQKGDVKTKKISGLKKTVSVKKGKKYTLKPVISPITSVQKITYTSSNKKIASVSGKGVIKGMKKGKAKITVKSGSKKYVVTVTVK